MRVCEQCGASHQLETPLCERCSGVTHSPIDPPARAPATTANTLHSTPKVADDAGGGGEPAGELIGKTLLGQFEVLRKLGQGGFGAVYLAEQRGVERRAVIKVLHRRLARDPAAVKRFQREAKALARLDHHHLVKLYNFGELEDGALFLAMEYGGDQTLADVIRDRGALPAERVCRLGEQICEALAEAHARGVVHRDLKPANVLVADKHGADWVKVVDVGIAKLVQTDDAVGDLSTLTREGAIVGTPAYFSPEQSDGQRELDGRSDLYSLGVVLYEAISGKQPFQGSSLLDFVRAHALDKPPSLRGHGIEAAALEAVIFRALEKDPERRFKTALEMGNALRLAARARPARRRALVALLGLALLGAGVALYFRPSPRPSPAPDLERAFKAPPAPAIPNSSEPDGASQAADARPRAIDGGTAAAPVAKDPPERTAAPQRRAARAPRPAGEPKATSAAAPAAPRAVVERAWAHLTVKAPRTAMNPSGAAWRPRPDGGDLQLHGSSGSSSLASADGAWTIRLVWARREGGKLGLLFETEPASLVWRDDEPLGKGELVVEPGSPARISFRSPSAQRELALLVRLGRVRKFLPSPEGR